MSPIHNVALAASAGTGKTFALVTRYLGLMAAGVVPEEIVALTFSRKAAGEILERIVTRLARAAASSDPDHPDLKALNDALQAAGYPAFTPDGAAQALSQLTRALPGLRVGTLDSFFLQFLRQFRMEWGFSGDITISPDEEADTQHILWQLLHSRLLTRQDEAQLTEDFRLATFGHEGKSIHSVFEHYFQTARSVFQQAPDARQWGNASAIWPPPASNPVPQSALNVDWNELRRVWREEEGNITSAQIRKAWRKFCDEARALEQGALPSFRGVVAERLLAGYSFASDGEWSVTFGRGADSRHVFSSGCVQALQTWFSALFYQVFGLQCARTTGAFRLLQAEHLVRRDYLSSTGSLSFADVLQTLLSSPRTPEEELSRLQVDYRLDARFRHWLLDEFQDTSYAQWKILENLVDEAIQDTSGERSFFYVGDVKQAIYEWRGGSPALFHRILEKYPAPQLVRGEPLTASWRSSPVILDAVNAVFGDLRNKIPALPESILSAWESVWNPQQAVRTELPGYAALYVLPKASSSQEPATADAELGDSSVKPWWSFTADLVKAYWERDPHADDRSVAVICRSNAACSAMVTLLTERGLHAVWPGKSELLDNGLVPVLLSWIKLTEHPGDTLARQHVAMSPLVSDVADLSENGLLDTAREIARTGYAGILTRLAARWTPSEVAAKSEMLGALEWTRLQQLIRIAMDWDRQPRRPVCEFLQHVRRCSIPREQTGSRLQVLTIHQSKGLEYDGVFLADLHSFHGILHCPPHLPLMGYRSDSRHAVPEVDWVLIPPKLEFVKRDPVLSAAWERETHRAASGEIRGLYVAMTRARHELHMVTVEKPEISTVIRLGQLLQETLAPHAVPSADQPVWSAGHREWSRGLPPKDSTSVAPDDFQWPRASSVSSDQRVEETGLLLSTSPSGTEKQIVSPKALFRLDSLESRERGTRLHDDLSQIAWLEKGTTEACLDSFPAATRTMLLEFLSKPPEPNVELWREQHFEVVLNERWVTGIFDRVHIWRDLETGQAVRADILDFKTDRIPFDMDIGEYAQRYQAQMRLYSNALHLLVGLDTENIRTFLLFLHDGRVHITQ